MVLVVNKGGHNFGSIRLDFRTAVRIWPQLERLDRHRARRPHAMCSRHDLLIDCRVSNPVHQKNVCHEAQVQAVAAIVTKHE
eukprot:COSAG02_NODE_1479_length_12402_cov_5.937576_3_plen_82_part_00